MAGDRAVSHLPCPPGADDLVGEARRVQTSEGPERREVQGDQNELWRRLVFMRGSGQCELNFRNGLVKELGLA